MTLAFDSTLFHETGDFDARPALRNMYLDAQVTEHVSAWGGSRMYRGDQVYLVDRWLLDDLNTIGAGVLYRRRDGDRADRGNILELAAHAGVNRLDRDFQFQEIDAMDPAHGATTVTQLNRQRKLVSGTASYTLDGDGQRPSVRAKVHGEYHAISAGTRERMDGTLQDLPADSGFLIGTEVALYGFTPKQPAYRGHFNGYLRYAKGLAAFDELAPPTSFGADLRTTNANELLIGMGGAWDSRFGNLLVAAVSRRFIDADPPGADRDDRWEYAIVARPLAAVTREVFAGADVSYQAQFPRGLDPNALLAQDPAVFQIAPMIVYSPLGPSAYDRPQLRLVYRAAHRNQAARELFAPEDPRTRQTWAHFLGVQVEWWFNSPTYRQ